MKIKMTLLMVGLLSMSAWACQVPKSYYKHVSCTARAGVYLAVKDDGSPVALLNKNGEKTADLFAYDAVLASEFHAGLLPVRQGNKVGYINTQGKTVIAVKYDSLGGKAWARGVHDGRIVVKQNGGFGVIDTTGKTIVKPAQANEQISDFRQGRASVTTAGGVYQIDKAGSKIATAQVAKKTTNTQATKATKPQTQARATKPKAVPKPATPTNLTLIPQEKEGKWGFVDERGVPMIQFVFDEVKPFSEGLASVRMGDKWGFINQAGDLVVPFRFHKDEFIFDSEHLPQYAEPLVFYQGKAWISNLHTGEKLCINKRGVNVLC